MIKPFGPRVLIRRWPEVEVHPSGLILPALSREKPQIGKVVAVGNGWRTESGGRLPLDLKVGDDVVMEKFVSVDHKVMVDGEELLLVPYSQIYLVVEGFK